MTLVKNLRGYVRSAPGLPSETQCAMAAAAGVGVVYDYRTEGRAKARALWIRSLRAGDTAWLARLDILVLPKPDRPEGQRAAVDLAATVSEIVSRGATIVDGSTGITSHDGKRWAERVQWAARRVSVGIMSTDQARKQAAKSAIVRGHSAIVTQWKSPAMDAERERWAAVWRDAKYHNDQEAADALVEPLTGRKHLARRIFGRRKPNDVWAGGRPRKSKQ